MFRLFLLSLSLGSGILMCTDSSFGETLHSNAVEPRCVRCRKLAIEPTFQSRQHLGVHLALGAKGEEVQEEVIGSKQAEEAHLLLSLDAAGMAQSTSPKNVDLALYMISRRLQSVVLAEKVATNVNSSPAASSLSIFAVGPAESYRRWERELISAVFARPEQSEIDLASLDVEARSGQNKADAIARSTDIALTLYSTLQTQEYIRSGRNGALPELYEYRQWYAEHIAPRCSSAILVVPLKLARASLSDEKFLLHSPSSVHCEAAIESPQVQSLTRDILSSTLRVRITVVSGNVRFSDFRSKLRLLLLSEILAGSPASQMQLALRQDLGITYDLHGQTVFDSTQGFIVISFTTSEDHAVRAASLVNALLGNVRSEPFSATTVSDAKLRLSSRMAVRSLSDDTYLQDRKTEFTAGRRELKVIDNIKPVELNALAREVLKAGAVKFVVTGPDTTISAIRLHLEKAASVNNEGLR